MCSFLKGSSLPSFTVNYKLAKILLLKSSEYVVNTDVIWLPSYLASKKSLSSLKFFKVFFLLFEPGSDIK